MNVATTNLAFLGPALPDLTCRKCETRNPWVYFGPVSIDGVGSCVCYDCADSRGWLNADGTIKKGYKI